jgi:hypothetical protein
MAEDDGERKNPRKDKTKIIRTEKGRGNKGRKCKSNAIIQMAE